VTLVMARHSVICANGEAHGIGWHSFDDADNFAFLLDENPYTHCGPHAVASGDRNGNAVEVMA